MEGGAVGVQVNVRGKLGGDKARVFKAKRGFIAHSGNYAETLVERGSVQSMLRPGIVGVEVKIMVQTPKEFEMKTAEEIARQKEEAKTGKAAKEEKP
jgi:small subunit ribosomal protein S3